MHPTGLALYDPAGTELLAGPNGLAPELVDFRQDDGSEARRASAWPERFAEVPVPARPAGGRFDLFLGSHATGQFLPTTAESLPECAVIRNAFRSANAVPDRLYRANLTRMYLMPLAVRHEIEWTFTPWDTRNGCRISIVDANGDEVMDRYLIRGEPQHEEATVRMNGPGDPPAPWRIDCGLAYAVEAASLEAARDGVQNLALLGADTASMAAMAPLVPPAGRS
jgi:hypothetical protein